jgi:hypothetical protein
MLLTNVLHEPCAVIFEPTTNDEIQAAVLLTPPNIPE